MTNLPSIRAFAMAARLAETDLVEIANTNAIDLGLSESEDINDDYYLQFDETVRQEAATMSLHYQVFYCLEKTIRSLIADTLKDANTTWWTASFVPDRVISDVADRMQRDTDSGFTVRSDDPIDYTTFGELSQIITKNWPCFGSIFSSKRAVERVLANLNMLRGPIAHCSPLAEDEVLRLQLSVRDWFRLMD